MALPFTHAEFLEVFGRYNTHLWPAAVALWLLTAVVCAAWLRGKRVSGRQVGGLLALHWSWSAIAYHWMFFRSINPAATVFAGLFLLQAALFVWVGASGRGVVARMSGLRGSLAVGLVIAGLAYPAAGIIFGLRYPRIPLFAVPCPTTLVTAGLLLATHGWPRIIRGVPIIWAAIGSTAAFKLGIVTDFALVAAAGALTLDALLPPSQHQSADVRRFRDTA
jgi:hypothetical protein